jgi:signal transduction histidine kinase/HPt (histidine-containing phosphotransfer) domain-containing protein/FixJ family two-component response regulator
VSAPAPPRRRPPSLRRLLAVLLGILGVLVAALIVVTTLQLRGSQSQADAENRRAQSFLLADSMRQSSNDLTNMVRLFVATGNHRYREYYEQILAIRSGRAPRPRGYDSTFWDRVLAGDDAIEYGPPESLVAQMRDADFTAAEFAALAASLRASDGLARLEVDVMDRVERRIRRGVDAAYRADVARDYQRLVDRAYLREKGVIMNAIARFIDLVEARTRREVERVRSDNDALFAVQIAILALIVLVGAGAMIVLSRIVVRPVGRLAAATRRIAGGDYGERTDVRGVAEVEQVAGAFNEMADAIQADIGARERAEREAVDARAAAEEANAAKSTFLAAMSHEIRTPMTGVTGMLEVLARTDLTPQQRQMVATAETSAHSLLQIIGDVLDFSKIEAAKLELASVPMSLRAVVEGAVETFRQTASAKGLLLDRHIDERLAAAHVGDPLRLRQIVTNLLSNAVKFTEVGGIEVAVRVLADGAGEQRVEITVTDTGIGVSAERQRELFSDFAQAEASTAQRFGGTGLGLAICRRLAELMGGELTMQSAAGRGTTMRLTVSLAVGDAAAEEAVAAAQGAADARVATRPKPGREQAQREGSLLLVAEDHAVNRAVLRHQLAAIGFEADFADDGRDALARFRSGRYALVLTDVNMPELDGYELTRAIRRHERESGAARTPILALTANVMEGEPARCRDAGMDDFAAKPTTIPFLGAKLRAWLPHLGWHSDAGTAAAGATAAARAEDGGPFDLAVLAEVTGGDAALAAALIADFAAELDDDRQALDDALAAGDLEAVRRSAHRIRGAARTVGAHAVATLAQQIETGAAAQDAEPLAPLAARLRGAVAECEAAAVAGTTATS